MFETVLLGDRQVGLVVVRAKEKMERLIVSQSVSK
jgi:hypothetical protein